MTDRSHWLLTGLLVLFIVGGVSLFLSSHELRDKEVYVGYSGEARRNDLLAAQRLLEAFDVTVGHQSSLGDMTDIPPDIDTILLASHSRQLTGERLDRLLTWVDGGGSLLAFSQGDTDADELSTRLQVEHQLAEPRQVSNNDQPVLTNDRLRIFWSGESTLHSQRPDVAMRWRDDVGIRIMRLPHGDGSVTLSVSSRQFENRQIGKGDHAELLWELISGHQQVRRVLIVGGADMPFILTILWQAVPGTLLTGLLLLGIWLGSRAQRFGPMRPTPGTDRRRLSEHVVAGGRFLWQRKALEALLAPLRDDARLRLERYRPDLQRLPAGERDGILAGQLRLPAELIGEALDPRSGTPANSEQFIEIVRTLQAIRGLRSAGNRHREKSRPDTRESIESSS